MTNHVKVTRLPTPGDPPWRVVCDICGDGGFLADMFGRGVILHARHDAWSQAMWWARWHAAEHVRDACPTCGHAEPLPKTVVLDADTVKVGERLFRRDGASWREAA